MLCARVPTGPAYVSLLNQLWLKPCGQLPAYVWSLPGWGVVGQDLDGSGPRAVGWVWALLDMGIAESSHSGCLDKGE